MTEGENGLEEGEGVSSLKKQKRSFCSWMLVKNLENCTSVKSLDDSNMIPTKKKNLLFLVFFSSSRVGGSQGCGDKFGSLWDDSKQIKYRCVSAYSLVCFQATCVFVMISNEQNTIHSDYY